ncbi:hypothetical protein [Pseudotenacibaculum haliotis]|uniref:Uncharacterized protein n=1 Tax=Pseudotenacibaculum haliotis TaxID=1862138 RepID=A0ABW5LXA2_9FLAO
MEYDLLKSRPRKRWNEYLEDDTYVIPCKVMEIDSEPMRVKYVASKIFRVKIEILNFYEKKISSGFIAYTYQKSLEIFKGLNKIPPFYSECTIIKRATGEFHFVVYGAHNTHFVWDILFSDFDEIDEGSYNDNYKDLREWIKQ